MGYNRVYYLKKAYALYPGVLRPTSALVFQAHYRSRQAGRSLPRAMLDGLIGLGFLAWIPWRARRVQRKFGLDAEWRRRATAIARERFADPNDIALFGIERADALDGYIRRFEDAALNKRINPLGWTPDCALADKRRFAERCTHANLPHPETVAAVADGRTTVLADPQGRVLIAKPAFGEGGGGVRVLGAFADEADLAARLPNALGPRRGAIVVQPQLRAHPALAGLALSALPTVRIVTILDEAGRPEVVAAVFRCAGDPHVVVDNMKAGGLFAAVNLASGELGIARKGYSGGEYHAHPVTGAAITARPLPDWRSACDLVARAHADAFADYALIGWDVALTTDGPSLIEGNGKPGVLMLQRAAGRGLAEGRYGALLAHHLAAALNRP